MMMMNIFQKYQNKAYTIYNSIGKSGKFSNSYLFVGPASSQKDEAAIYFALLILGCCKPNHPDLHILENCGAKEYTVDQVRGVVSDIGLAPIVGKNKVYIFKKAERLGDSCANAFLKTLEEPPLNTCIILLANNEDNVLPTILSRCNVVPFVEVPIASLVSELQKKTNLDVCQAQFFLILTDSNLLQALKYSKIDGYFEAFNDYFELLSMMNKISDIEFIYQLSEVFQLLITHLELSREEQKERLRAVIDFHTSHSRNEQEKQDKRSNNLQIREHLRNLITATQAFFHDYALIGAGVGEVLPQELVAFPQKFYAENNGFDPAVVVTNVSNASKNAIKRLELNVAIRNVLDSFAIELKKVFR
ncbi:MAG: hypothetical protein HUJ51_04445 [Eggerthellaceae bacterium]|nr:hypothetical protein [Eggerthellaceae bacterium]